MTVLRYILRGSPWIFLIFTGKNPWRKQLEKPNLNTKKVRILLFFFVKICLFQFSPSAVSTDRFLCVDSRRTGESLLTSLPSCFLATLWSEGISPDTDWLQAFEDVVKRNNRWNLWLFGFNILGETGFQKLQSFLVTRAAQKVFSTSGSNYLGQFIVLWPFNIQNIWFFRSIKNCIAYANESNTVNPPLPHLSGPYRGDWAELFKSWLTLTRD